VKVIHYIGSLSFGGIERLVCDLVSQQKKRVELDVAIGIGNSKGEFKQQFEALGAPLINFNLTSGFDLNPLKIFKISRHLKNFEIIHLHGFHLSVALAALWSRKKIIYTEHGNFGFGRKIKTTDKHSFFLRKLFFKFTAVEICCNSTFSRQQVEKYFYKGKRLNVVCNGSSMDYNINEQLLLELKNRYSNKYVIGVTGRLAGVKRIDTVIDTFKLFLEYNNSALLLIIGEGLEKERLLAKVKSLKISENVYFLGFQNEIMTYQSIFDVSIIGSKNEAFGLVTIESYLLKTPILAFNDGGGVVEIINRFEPKDVCEDKKTMVERLDYYNKHDFKWENHFNEQLAFFSLKRMEQDYFNQYKAISSMPPVSG